MASEPHFQAGHAAGKREPLEVAAYFPESNPVGRWFQEFRRSLSNRVVETVKLPQVALMKAQEPYLRDPARLRYSSVSPDGWKASNH
jgi:hypothetical protein